MLEMKKKISVIIFTLFYFISDGQVLSKNDDSLDVFERTYLNNENLVYQKSQDGKTKKWYLVKYVYTDNIRFTYKAPTWIGEPIEFRALYLLTEKESGYTLPSGSFQLPIGPNQFFIGIGNVNFNTSISGMIPLTMITQYLK